MLNKLKPASHKSIPFLIFISFLTTFIISRLVVTFFPGFFVPIRNNHVHHYAYGIIILSILSFVLITFSTTYKDRLRLSLVYGFGLGLAFDEFGMWLLLEDAYNTRTSYDAILIISLVLLNIIYFSSFWKKWGHRLHRLAKIIFFSSPKRFIRYLYSLLPF